MTMTDFDNVAKWGRFIQSLPRWQKVLALMILAGGLYILFVPLRTAQRECDQLTEELKQSASQLVTVRDEKAALHRELLSYKEILDPIRKKAVQLYPELETTAALAKLAQDLDEVRSLATRDTYRPLAPEIKGRIIQHLRALRTELGTNMTVEVAVENGSTSRQSVAKALVDILAESGISVKGPSGIMTLADNPLPKISLRLNPDDFGTAEQLAGPISLYINLQMTGFNQTQQERGILKIHIVGEPLFSPEGVVTFK